MGIRTAELHLRQSGFRFLAARSNRVGTLTRESRRHGPVVDSDRIGFRCCGAGRACLKSREFSTWPIARRRCLARKEQHALFPVGNVSLVERSCLSIALVPESPALVSQTSALHCRWNLRLP